MNRVDSVRGFCHFVLCNFNFIQGNQTHEQTHCIEWCSTVR
ncbi:tryptophanyl-tRNA synthetase domain protein [Vibrio cholerae O1 str. NHCC-008D]|nr:tryptophanyl-tRNA synthetase domain protein [Vibrio cholerae O1 str. NHCC-008D]